jgi:poly-gamma-glutamate synthesis protein (capsule biosynthesis protein)
VIALGADEKSPWQPRVLVEKDGKRVCAVAWTTFVNTEARACPASGKLALAGQDALGTRAIVRAIGGARASGCDATIAIFHGGKEYETQSFGALPQARIAAEAGADAVIVHHPHVPSPVHVYETRDGRQVPVFVSVGNLVSNQGESYRSELPPVSPEHYVSLNAWTRLGVIADLEWAWPIGGGLRERPSLAYGYHLTWTENEHAVNRATPMPRITVRPLDPTEDRPLIDRLSTDADGPTPLFEDPCWIERGVTRCVPTPPARSARRRDGVSDGASRRAVRRL